MYQVSGLGCARSQAWGAPGLKPGVYQVQGLGVLGPKSAGVPGPMSLGVPGPRSVVHKV